MIIISVAYFGSLYRLCTGRRGHRAPHVLRVLVPRKLLLQHLEQALPQGMHPFVRLTCCFFARNLLFRRLRFNSCYSCTTSGRWWQGWLPDDRIHLAAGRGLRLRWPHVAVAVPEEAP
jgi:hypothetical protein